MPIRKSLETYRMHLVIAFFLIDKKNDMSNQSEDFCPVNFWRSLGLWGN